MPKKFSAFILALLLLGTLSTAAAASANSQTEVSVSFSGLSPENESAPALSYEVIIPATYNTQTEPCLAISARNVSIGQNKQVAVFLDGERTFDENGQLFLTNTQNPNVKVLCQLFRSGTYGVMGEWINTPGDCLVASFVDGATSPTSYGYLVASASADDSTIDGTYTGTIYFKIGTMDI